MNLTQIILYVSAHVDDFNTRAGHAQQIADTIDQFADRSALKKRKGELLKVQTEYNEDYRTFEKEVSRMVYDRLSELEGLKNADGRLTGYDEEVRQLYLLLHEYGGRFNSRYVKMPGEWLSLGMMAGLLEDMIVVLRTPVQIGLGSNHMYSLTEFVRGFKEFLDRDDQRVRLIQKKQSKLSKWERGMVVRIFERNYYHDKLKLKL